MFSLKSLEGAVMRTVISPTGRGTRASLTQILNLYPQPVPINEVRGGPSFRCFSEHRTKRGNKNKNPEVKKEEAKKKEALTTTNTSMEDQERIQGYLYI